MSRPNDILYRLCSLERSLGDGKIARTSTWLPEKHKGTTLEPGVRVQLKDHVSNEVDTEWWNVLSVSESTQTAKRAHERAHAWSKYMAATDI